MPRWGIMRLDTTASCLFLGLSTALTPHRPLHHARQEISDAGNTTTTSSQEAGGAATSTATSTGGVLSITCDAELEKIISVMPTPAPEHDSFSSSYYESHPRTAEYSDFDCDWMAEIPEDLDQITLEVDNTTAEWFLGLDPNRDAEVFTNTMEYLTCAAANYDSLPCQTEWDDYFAQVEERVESAGGPVLDTMALAGIPVSVLAAIGVSLLGVL